MAIARILVDGFSLLHAWPQLAKGKPRFSAAARDELINQIRRYGDAISTPITIVFDGAGPAPNVGIESPSTTMCEILYSKSGQTADDIIERVTAKLVQYGEVLVVSNDFAERDTVASVGGTVCSCEYFIRMIQSALGEFEKDLKRHNQAELKRFRQG